MPGRSARPAWWTAGESNANFLGANEVSSPWTSSPWSWHVGSNHAPPHHGCGALPDELYQPVPTSTLRWRTGESNPDCPAFRAGASASWATPPWCARPDSNWHCPMLEIGASATLGYGRVRWAGEDSNLQARRAARLQRVGVTRHPSCPNIGAPGRTLPPDPPVRSQPLCTLSKASVAESGGIEPRPFRAPRFSGPVTDHSVALSVVPTPSLDLGTSWASTRRSSI